MSNLDYDTLTYIREFISKRYYKAHSETDFRGDDRQDAYDKGLVKGLEIAIDIIDSIEQKEFY